jgi:hypothetical protein
MQKDEINFITMKEFNTAGPCNKEEHYMIDAATRLQGVEQLIDSKKYFVIHAARQSGKTTYLKDLANRLNTGGQYYALWCSLENTQNIVEPKEGIYRIVKKIENQLRISNLPHKTEFAKDADYSDYTNVLNMELTLFCMLLDKPLVILFDEVDCLSEDTLISFLRQLRDGYNGRPEQAFPHSVALVGMRNIRDYKAQVRPESATPGSASPFNIVTRTYTLQNFTKEEITQLYSQHTAETGQIFEEDAIESVYEQTQGQPWLVNAIAREVIMEILQSDYTKPVTTELVNEAIPRIILNRPTHIDYFFERLKEEPVRRIIESIVFEEYYNINRKSDDFQYVKDLGLITETKEGIEPANPVYGEIIACALNYDVRNSSFHRYDESETTRYLKNGRIDMDCLMRDFQQYWRDNSGVWVKKGYLYESEPVFQMTDFIGRIVKDGRYVNCSMGTSGTDPDFCMRDEYQKYPIRLKTGYGNKCIEEGFEETIRLMNRFNCNEGWLVVFDLRSTVKWEDKLYMKKETVDGKTITIVGA